MLEVWRNGCAFVLKETENMSKDTAGQERFHTITTSYYRGAMGIMLVYDITQEKTFDNIAKWLRNIDEHASEGVERMILGNKCDMEDKRMVNKERGEGIAREHGIKFYETSAKDNINVEDAFTMLTQDILRKHLAGASNDQTSSGVVIEKDNSNRGKAGCC